MEIFLNIVSLSMVAGIFAALIPWSKLFRRKPQTEEQKKMALIAKLWGAGGSISNGWRKFGQ